MVTKFIPDRPAPRSTTALDTAKPLRNRMLPVLYDGHQQNIDELRKTFAKIFAGSVTFCDMAGFLPRSR
jgi:hypothetical protein